MQVHTAIHAAKPGVHVASTSNEAVISGAVNLTDYDTVIWILGNESTANDTFNATEQTKVTQFITAGGNLFVSGSEIAWDLDQQNNGRTFFENTLKGNLRVRRRGHVHGDGRRRRHLRRHEQLRVLERANAFSSLDTQLYNVASPDVIAPQAGAVAALTYSNGAGHRGDSGARHRRQRAAS